MALKPVKQSIATARKAVRFAEQRHVLDTHDGKVFGVSCEICRRIEAVNDNLLTIFNKLVEEE